MIEIVDIGLLTLLAITGLGIARLRNLFAVVLLGGIYSFLSAGLFMTMDAHDVAFTEAAVGVGISTVLFLGALTLLGHEEKPQKRSNALPLLVVVITGGILTYGIMDVPPFGNPDNPVHQHVAPRYIHEQEEDIGVDNLVTAVLASYRGFDTLGEVAVIFSAGVGVLLLLAGPRQRNVSAAGGRDDRGGEGAPRGRPGPRVGRSDPEPGAGSSGGGP